VQAPSPIRAFGQTIVPSRARGEGTGGERRAFWPKTPRGSINLRGTIAGSLSLFPACSLQGMAQLRRIEPSVRRESPTVPWAVLAQRSGSPTYANQPAGRFGRRSQAAKTAVPIRSGAPGRPPLQIPMSFAGPACVIVRAQKKPPAGCPAGGRQLKSSREHQGTMSRWTRMRSP
jgi:hypothetical protein